ncbi:unnamed protein product [Prunus armeniaca]
MGRLAISSHFRVRAFNSHKPRILIWLLWKTRIRRRFRTPASLSDEAGRASLSDEAVILASSCPKRRSGRRVFKETRHPVYRGVRRRNNNKWVCELREPNNKKARIWLGTYPTADMAARAHDVAALAFRGNLACLNFADSVPASTDAAGIRRAATEAAEAFRQAEDGGVDEKESKAVVSEEKGCVEMEGSSNLFYLDEEEIFEMPRLLDDMAEGLMLSPPECLDGYMNLG